MILKIVREDALSDEDDQRIRDLLVAAFPQYTHLFSKASYYYARPEFRLWLEDDRGMMAAHMDFERRTIQVGDDEVLVAGVGEVATHPAYQGTGVGRQLMAHLLHCIRSDHPADFGFLQCRPAVAGFYERVGWRRIDNEQTIIELDMQTSKYIEAEGPALIAPGTKRLTDWPDGATVHLRGLPW